jgi:ABC-2 type transport system ATP-binding protein
MLAIEIQQLSKDYQVGFLKKQLRPGLKPLSLTVSVGETFGFLGPNGAGKTTTLKLLMGIIFPTSGSAKILGKDFHDPEIKSKIGFLPEQPYFYDYLSAPELLDYYAELCGVPVAERKRGIAQAIVHDPELLFLDEPMSGLDPLGRHEIRELIQGLKDAGKTIFFSTHILSDAEALCDRVGVIHKGELRGVGVVNDLRSSAGGKSEIIWQGSDALPTVNADLLESHVTGDLVRAIIISDSLDIVLTKLRQAHGRLISVTPLHGTLEEYFLSKTTDQEQVGA